MSTAKLRPSVRTFQASDTGAAAELLAARHTRHRAVSPLLPERFTDPGECSAQVQALLDAGASGAVAEVDGSVTAYVLGVERPSAVWGRNVWVEAAGVALAEGVDPEVLRDVYATAAGPWVEEEGRDAHYVLLPVGDVGLVDAFFRLGFGAQHAHAVRPLAEAGWTPRWEHGVVREARLADVPVLAELDLELPRHQGLSPVFSAGEVPTYDEAVADWEESLGRPDDGFAYLVAEAAGRVVGSAVGCPLEKSSGHSPLMRPDGAAFLGFAAVLPAARGLGAGRALGEAVLAWAGPAGHSCIATDWRVTNLLSSRAWPRLGYRTTFLRLHRLLGH